MPKATADSSAGVTEAANARKNSKSRTGCKRCKARRLKCDELKPHCLQCQKRNTECPGYAIVLQWSAKHEKFQSGRLAGNEVENVGEGVISQPAAVEPTISDVCPDSNIEFDSPAFMPNKDFDFGIEFFESLSSLDLLGDTSSTSSLSSPLNTIQEDTAKNEPSIEGHPSATTNDASEADPATWNDLDRLLARIGSVPKFLIHMPTVLVDHYFDSVCNIFSSFDNSMNPFRSVVERLWNGWAPLYFTIQSMSAGFLSNDFPHMAELGRQLQSEAYTSLHQFLAAPATLGREILVDDKVLLTIIMLGGSTTWHKSGDLGQGHKQAATQLFQKRRRQQSLARAVKDRHDLFFEQCILYWEMPSAIMSDTPLVLTEYLEGGPPISQAQSPQGPLLHFPHPWTGVSPQVLSLFAQVGRLARCCRQLCRGSAANAPSPTSFCTEVHTQKILSMELQSSRAAKLEDRLLTLPAPLPETLVDTGDSRTPLDHYLLIHESHRCAALILLYRNFPELLHRRLPLSAASEFSQPVSVSYLQVLTGGPPEELNERAWITSLATTVVDMLRKLPTSSGTRFFQPLLILVAGSELQFSAPSKQLSIDDIKLAQARRFVLQRLHELQVDLPRGPVSKVQMTVTETWRRMDAGEDVFWLDVMIDHGWETIAG